MKKEFNLPDGEWYLYFLKCANKYFYVGITTNLDRRLSQHENGGGCSVTKENRPLELISAHYIGYMPYEEAEKYEDAFTLQRIIEYGKRCRGGRFCAGCKPTKAKRILKETDEKYKEFLELVDYSYAFKRPKVTRKEKEDRKKRAKAERQKQIQKAIWKNQQAIIRRFGKLNP